jgi:hypothetical protein
MTKEEKKKFWKMVRRVLFVLVLIVEAIWLLQGLAELKFTVILAAILVILLTWIIWAILHDRSVITGKKKPERAL